MLNIEYSPFSLKSFTSTPGANDQKNFDGAVLKITWPDKRTGYSSIMPRLERNDLPLLQHFSDFRKGKISLLMEQAISFAKNDANLRQLNQNAFEGVKKIRNCYFVAEPLKLDSKAMALIKDQNFVTLMINVGQDLAAEVEVVRKVLKMSKFLVRLNFNAKADWPSFERFMSVIEPGLKPRIEFVVDPMPYDQEAWKEAARFAPLAIDSQLPYLNWSKPESLPQLKVVIIRPTTVDVNDVVVNALKAKAKLVVSCSFEHPIAIAHSLLVASDLNTKYPLQVLDHDCLYQNIFATHVFSGTLATQGPFIVSPTGKGIGFSRQLDKIDWNKI